MKIYAIIVTAVAAIEFLIIASALIALMLAHGAVPFADEPWDDSIRANNP